MTIPSGPWLAIGAACVALLVLFVLWWRSRDTKRAPNMAMWCSLLRPGARQYQGSLADRGIHADLDIWVDRDGALKLGALVGKRSLWTLLEPTEVAVESATVIARFKAALAEIEARGN